ncbi:MAG: ATP-binding protein, partial [Acidobacteriota bacterium]
MKFPFHFERARTRLAISGALLCALFLSLLAWGARTSVRAKTYADIDEELYTLAVALGSSFELEGLEESKRDTLKAGLEVNAFEFRLANHSAILFREDTPVAASGNLLKTRLPGGISPYRERPEVPYSAVEPYSGQNRMCRFLVTHLQGKAHGATLVLFRWIGPNLRSLGRLDRALAGFVLLGFLGTAGILAGVVTRALKTVEEVTATAEAVEATDLSKRVRVRKGRGEEFRRLAAVINSLLERLELAFRAQKRLIADAAHELKTPTAVLVGEAQEALRPDATPEERRESLETIERVARGLAREVDALLLLARGDAAAPSRRAPLDIGELVEQAVEATEPLGGPRGVRCAFRRIAPAWVIGDPAGLQRLASNLISNAVLYSSRGSVVEIASGSDGREAFLEVRDRGPGIAPEERARIFDRFVRLDSARAENPEGSGLGLAIVEQVVRAHQGRIEVEDRPGGGAIFRAVLPACEPEIA